MNKDTMTGKWKEIKGKVQEKWGRITDDELDQIDGKRNQLIGKVQQHYGRTKEQAEKEVDNFLQS